MVHGRLGDKVAIVTGAASGIGRAVAIRFAHEGAKVAMVDVNKEGLQDTQRAIAQAGGEATPIAADISVAGECQRVVQEAASRYGKLDILANMHGVTDMADTKILTTPEEVFRRTWEVNTKAIFLLCQQAIPEMKKAGGGSIINMSSGAALTGSGGIAYSASKGALNAMTRVIAYQHAADLIRCNVLCAGPIDTPMLQRSMKKLGRENVPMPPGSIPRVGRPEEVAALVAFLASDEAAYITAATYTIDGGMTAH